MQMYQCDLLLLYCWQLDICFSVAVGNTDDKCTTIQRVSYTFATLISLQAKANTRDAEESHCY